MEIDRFDLPMPPPGLTFPEDVQHFLTVMHAGICAIFVAYCLYQSYKTRSLLPILLTVGGGIAFLWEPFDDILGLCWFPRVNQGLGIYTYGPVPIWVGFIYVYFFGSMAYILLRALQRGITRRQFWIGVSVWWVVNLFAELPAIHYGIYYYYNNPPWLIFDLLPAYWLFINCLGALLTVALLLRTPQLFQGWRMAMVPLLPMTTDAMGSIAAGWPIFSALNTPGASSALKWAAGGLTIVISLFIIDCISRLVCTDAVKPGTD